MKKYESTRTNNNNNNNKKKRNKTNQNHRRIPNFTRMAILISWHPVAKSNLMNCNPCNPALLPQNTCSILLCKMFISNLFEYLVAGNTIWKLGKRTLESQLRHFPLKTKTRYFTRALQLSFRINHNWQPARRLEVETNNWAIRRVNRVQLHLRTLGLAIRQSSTA